MLAIFGTMVNRKLWKVSSLIWCIFAVQSAVCVGIALDWDCRFIARVIPLLFLLASAGIVLVWQRIEQCFWLCSVPEAGADGNPKAGP